MRETACAVKQGVGEKGGQREERNTRQKEGRGLKRKHLCVYVCMCVCGLLV